MHQLGIAKGTRRSWDRRLGVRALVAAAALTVWLVAAPGADAVTGAAPAWDLKVIHGPTNVPITAPVDAQAKITITGENGNAPNVGKFKISWENEEKENHTKFLPFNATAKEVQEALQGMKIIGPGNVEVTGGPQTPGEASWSYVITFKGALGGQELELEKLEVEEETRAGEETKYEKEHPGELAEGDSAEAEPTRNGRHDFVSYEIVPTNIGGAATSGKITLTDILPPHLVLREVEGREWSCKPGGPGFTCGRETPVQPGAVSTPIMVTADLETEAVKEGEQLVDTATVAGGGASKGVLVEDKANITSTPAQFGIIGNTFTANAYGPAGEKLTQAGAHPYSAITSFYFNTVLGEESQQELTKIVVPGNLKDAFVTLPAGFVGNPQALPRCSQAEFTEGTPGGPVEHGHCPENTRVGTSTTFLNELPSESSLQNGNATALYNLVPPPGVPAEFGFIIHNVPIRLDGHLVREPNGEYRVGVLSADINEAFNVIGVSITLWGNPADPSHDAERNKEPFNGEAKPFLTNPTDCVASATELPTTTISYDRWEAPGELVEDLPVPGPLWHQADAVSPAVTGCQALKWEPSVSFEPSTQKAGAPSGYKFKLHVPDEEAPEGLATPELKDTTVTLPAGLSLSASAATGLVACNEQQIDVASTAPGKCPEASQVGTVKIKSQLLEQPLSGRVYVGEPECSPCSPTDAEDGKIFKLFIEAEGSGVRVKLPGSASINQSTGLVSTTFANNPQTPFTDLELNLKGGERATLANPLVCGTYAMSTSLTPWSVGGTGILGDEVAHPSAPFAIDWDGLGGKCPTSLPFNPSFQAGTETTTADAFTPFDVVFSRGDDREQTFSGTTVATPPGLLGKLAGIERCAEPAASTGACPASSRIATATSVAGPGSEPFVVSGPVYLTDGYKGAPFGLSIAVPAKAGPFNLGTVVVRAAINVNKSTSAITITSDPLPQSVDGVPFRLKQVDVRVDRPGFMFNATNCEPKAITATLTGAPQQSGEAASVVTKSAPYTASGCSALQFGPTITATTDSNVSRSEGTSFAVTVTAQPGQANIHQVELQLPTSLPSRLPTLHGACRDTVFNESPSKCPAQATVGHATAITPLLSQPLKGPAILVSHANVGFPDLVFLLEGENGLLVELVGHTDIKNGITYSRFETVPDAPVTSFTTTFPRGPFSLLSGYGNLCAGELLAPTKIVGQNGAVRVSKTHIAVEHCGKPKPSISITRMRITGTSVVVSVKLSAAGTVKISGSGLKTTSKSLGAGSHAITVKLTTAGRAARRAHKRIRVLASLSAGGSSASRTAKVRL